MQSGYTQAAHDHGWRLTQWAPWDAELATAMQAEGFAVFEEQVAESLLADLADRTDDRLELSWTRQSRS